MEKVTREKQCDTLNQLCKRGSVSNSIDHYVPCDHGGKIGAGHSGGYGYVVVMGGLGVIQCISVHPLFPSIFPIEI